MNSTPLISIIVPVYNVEAYLEQCLESLVNQSYQNIEIICVNDGSPDNSSAILEQFVKSDRRVRVINQVNRGLSGARNTGLSYAKGEYLMFVDSDDWLDLETCNQAVSAIEGENADVALWSYVSEHNTQRNYKHVFSESHVFDAIECRTKLHRRFVGLCNEELAHPELADSLGPVWGKLYKREVVERSGARFVDLSEIGTYEDGLFNLEVFGYVNKAVYLDECFYHYRRCNSGSITSGYKPHLFECWQNLYLRMERYIQAHALPDEYYAALNNRRALGLVGLGLNILSSEFPFAQKLTQIGDVLSDPNYRLSYQALELHYFPLHWKSFYFCAKHHISIGVYLLLLMIQAIIR